MAEPQAQRVFVTTPTFRRSFAKLTPEQQAEARWAFALFQKDPFHPRLRPHTINRLSSRYQLTVYSVTVTRELRALFTMDGNRVISLNIGTHDIYRLLD